MSDDFNLDIIQNDAELEKLCTDSVELINYARNIVVNHVNIVQIMTYYSLGRWIVETQQMGEKRAKYGSKVIKTLSEKLQKEFGKGFSEDTLKNARKFYLTYKERISETVFSLFAIEKSETVFSFFEKEPPFIVSWSHYLQLMRIENEAKKVAEDVDEETMLQAIKDKLDYKEVREDIREFREKFAELIEEAGIKKLVIFVDELDRCNPATILDTLEAMRLFLFSGNVSFVIGADERHVTYAIRSKFNDIEGINMDIGKEYQEKLIQYPIRIPCMNKDETEFYIMCLLSEIELNETEFDGLLKFLQVKRKENAKEYIDNKYPCNDGGWIHYRVTAEEQLADISTLIATKCGK